jgi:hypothetical protein
MKQNDFAMTQSDLKAAALTISDLYTHQQTLVDTTVIKGNSSSASSYFIRSPFEERQD